MEKYNISIYNRELMNGLNINDFRDFCGENFKPFIFNTKNRIDNYFRLAQEKEIRKYGKFIYIDKILDISFSNDDNNFYRDNYINFGFGYQFRLEYNNFKIIWTMAMPNFSSNKPSFIFEDYLGIGYKNFIINYPHYSDAYFFRNDFDVPYTISYIFN